MNSRLEEKLMEVNGGYHPDNYSVGRVLLSVSLFPEEFSNLSQEVYSMIKEKQREDFMTCVDNVVVQSYELFGYVLPKIREGNTISKNFKIITRENENLKVLSEEFMKRIDFDSMSDELKEAIRKRRNTSLRRLKHKNNDILSLSHSVDDSSSDLSYIKIGYKIKPVRKFAQRSIPLISPNQKDLISVYTHPEDINKHTLRDYRENFKEEMRKLLLYALSFPNQDILTTIQTTQFQESIPGEFNKSKIVDLIDRTIMNDNGRATLIIGENRFLTIEEDITNLHNQGKISVISQEDYRKPLNKDDPFSYQKDGSYVATFTEIPRFPARPGSSCEIRYIPWGRYGEATLGLKNHAKMKKNQNDDFRKRLQQDSDFELFCNNLHKTTHYSLDEIIKP